VFNKLTIPVTEKATEIPFKIKPIKIIVIFSLENRFEGPINIKANPNNA
jgi:hypothetical protein